MTAEKIPPLIDAKKEEKLADPIKNRSKNWFWDVMWQSKLLYLEIFIASIVVNLFVIAVPLFTMNVYDRVVPNQSFDTLWVLAIGIGLIFIIDTLLKAIRTYFIDFANKKTDCQLSPAIFEHIIGLKMSNRPKSVGSLINTVQSFESFRDFITSGAMLVLIDLPFLVIFLFFIYLIGGPLFWIGLIVLPLICIMGILIQGPLIELTKKSYHHSSEKQTTLLESLAAAESIKFIGAESSIQAKWEKITHDAAVNGIQLRSLTNHSANFTQLIQQIASIVMVIAGVYMISHNHLTMGGLIACNILLGRALAPASQISSLFNRYFQSVHGLNSLDKIMQMETDNKTSAQAVAEVGFEHSIEFKNVSFHYPNEEINALNQVNLKINKGDRIALIGRIGSGKSSITKLLTKLYTPDEGNILIDGKDLQDIDTDYWRQHIGFMPQEVVLFYGSIRDNISVGAPYVADDLVLAAAERCGVTRFTHKHHQGLNRQVGEKGANLSGGQRQAVALARTLLLKPKLLIMDEPTSAFDDISERLFKRMLDDYLGKDGTLILVTHKIKMLDIINKVVVVDSGHIVAEGTYAPEKPFKSSLLEEENI